MRELINARNLLALIFGYRLLIVFITWKTQDYIDLYHSVTGNVDVYKNFEMLIFPVVLILFSIPLYQLLLSKLIHPLFGEEQDALELQFQSKEDAERELERLKKKREEMLADKKKHE